MEAVGELDRPSENGSSLLILPGSCPWEDDDEPLGLGGIKPKSSPIPRRRSSESCCSEDDSQPPPSISRRVSFADAFGLSLVSIKQFDSWAMCGPSGPLERDLNKEQDHFLSLLFTLPQTPEELLLRVREQKLELESLALLPGTTTLKGTIRVLNLCFDKLVFIRMSLDCWRSHFDLLAEYVPGLSYGDTDCFSFKLTLVPPFGKHGVRVDFCLRYDTPLGNFWANNNGQNYVVFCCEKAKEEDENEGKYKRKSCLKSTSLGSPSKTSSTSSTNNIPEIVLNCGSGFNTEPVQEKTMQEECIKLQEENIRNHSRRTKRRAEQQAKVQQYFAQTEEKDFEKTGASTSEAAAMTHGNEWTPAKGQMVSNPSTPETDAGREMNERPAELLKVEGQESTPGSVDTDMQVPAVPIKILDMVNIPALHPEVTTARYEASSCPTDSVNHHKVIESSYPQALAISQDKETIPSQTVSVAQHLHSSDMSVSMCVEKVWECFEKSAVERIVSTDNTRRGQDTNIAEGKASHGGSAILESNLRIQPLGQTFTFETVVAPLYHQVFERIEMERRDIMSRGIHAQGPAGNCKDGSLREVTYQSYPSAPSEKASPNVCMSEKNVVNDVHHEACKETFSQNVLSVTKNANPCLRLNNKLITEMDANTPLTDIPEDPLHGHFSESKILQTVTATKEEHLKYTLPLQQEHSQNYTLSWEKEPKETPDRFILLNKLSKDIEYSLDNMSVQGEYSEHSHQDPKPAACEALSAQCESDSTTAKTSLSIVSKNLPILDGRLTQISCETRFSSDVALTQTQNVEGTNTLEGLMFTENLLSLPPSNKNLEECHAPILHFTMFPAHLSGFRQCDATTLSHNLNSQATTQIQNPGNTSLKTRQKAAGTHDQSQITECTNQTEGSDNLQCYSEDDSHCIFWDLESNNDKNYETDECERNKTDISLHFATETRQAEKLHNNPEKTLNAQHINQINENEEHEVLDSDLSYRAVDFNVILDKATLIVSTNTDPEGSSTKKDNEQNVDKSKEQISSNMKEHHSIKLSEVAQKESALEEHKQEEEQQKLPQEEGQEPPQKKEQQKSPQEKAQQEPPEEKGQQKPQHEKGPQEPPQEKRPQEPPQGKEEQKSPQEKAQEPPEEKGPQEPPEEKGPQEPPQEKEQQKSPQEKAQQEPLEEKGHQEPLEGKGHQEPLEEKEPQEPQQVKRQQKPPQEKGPQEPPQEKGLQEAPQEKGLQEPPQEKGPQEPPQEKAQQDPPEEKAQQDPPEEKGQEPLQEKGQQKPPQEKGPQEPQQEKRQQKTPQEKGPQEPLQEKGQQEPPQEKGQQKPPQEKGPQEPPQEKEQQKSPQEKAQQEPTQEKGQQHPLQEKRQQKPPQEKGQQKPPQEKGPQEPLQEKGQQERPQEKGPQETPQEKGQQKAPSNEKYEAQEKQLQPQENYDQNEQAQEKEQKEQKEQREHGGKEQELDKEMQLYNEEHFEDGLHYNKDDGKAEEEKKEKDTGQIMEEWEDDDHLSLEGEIEEQKTVRGVKPVAVVEGNNNDNSLKNYHSLKQLCYETDKHQSAEGTLSDVELLLENEDIEEQDRNSLNEQSEKNMDDGRSTESLTDDDMELYLHSLKNTHQSVFRGCMSSGNHSKRGSINRTRTMPSPMPSISESMDEDQPNSSLEDLTNEETMQLEKATLPLMYEEEKVIGRNVLWWREFFSSDNMSKMFGYTFLFLLFLLTAYYYDFIACLGLYILALYWLYFHSESESVKEK